VPPPPSIEQMEAEILERQCSPEHRADVAAQVAGGGGPPVMFWGSCRLEGVSLRACSKQGCLFAACMKLVAASAPQQLLLPVYRATARAHGAAPSSSILSLLCSHVLPAHPACSARASLCPKPTTTSGPPPATSP
jgi:hypothetical protein